jgi:shikimate 5-dehydrogenase
MQAVSYLPWPPQHTRTHVRLLPLTPYVLLLLLLLPLPGYDGVYVPLLVDELDSFLAAFHDHDLAGLSVTIPHKEAAAAAATASGGCDDVAAAIGAVNTLVRQPDGCWRGYNTDWLGAISAIEARLAGPSGGGSSSSSDGASPLAGRTFVVLGAGGAGRALAFGAASRGARVIVANRNRQRAEALVSSVPGGATVADWDDVAAGNVVGDVLANTTAVGMVPDVENSPVQAAAVAKVHCQLCCMSCALLLLPLTVSSFFDPSVGTVPPACLPFMHTPHARVNMRERERETLHFSAFSSRCIIVQLLHT